MSILVPRVSSLPANDQRQIEAAFKSIQPQISQAIAALAERSASATRTQGLDVAVAGLQRQLSALTVVVGNLTPSGSGGGSTNPTVQYLATVSIPAYTAVYEDSPGTVGIADSSTAAKAVVGITKATTPAGAPVSLAGNYDNVSNTGWSWVAGLPVYLSSSGSMSQTPSGDIPIVMGYAISATQLLVVISASQPGVPASLYEVAGTVTIPVDYNLLVAGSMHISGDLILHGDAVAIPYGA